MSINLKDLKKFPGNKALGGEFMLLPIEAKKAKYKGTGAICAHFF